MNLQIRDMRPEDADSKGYVHWKTWQETYTGLMEENYLANQTLDKCRAIAHRFPQNTLVAETEGNIIGFSCYGRDDSGAGEVIAIYYLREYQGLGLGRKLMDATMAKLNSCTPITLYVLKGNDHAIGFYEHYGFRFDGTSQEISVGTELRMVYRK